MTKKSKIKSTQNVLGVIFMVVMLLGFIAVAYVNYDYSNNGENVQLYVSDSNLATAIIPYESTLSFSNTWSVQTGQKLDSNENDHTQINKTAVYVGNNTYSISVSDSGIGDTGITTNRADFVFELPDLSHQIINTINMTLSSNNESAMTYSVAIIHLSTDYWPQGTSIFSASNEPFSFSYAGDISGVDTKDIGIKVPINNAIQTYNDAKENTHSYMIISVGENPTKNGMSAFSFDVNVELFGSRVTGWSINDSISTVLAGSTALNIFVLVYMTDAIDIGGYTKKLKHKKRW